MIESMTTSEPHPAAPNPGHRFQFSLRAMFGLTTGTAAFFALGRMLGFADAMVVLVGVVITVGVIEWPRRVHLVTGLLLTLVAGTLLWANLRPSGWEREFNEMPPDNLDPVTKSMFYRGWPVGPWMLCYHQNLSIRRGGHGALVFDGIFFVIVLCVAKAACEWFVRGRDKATIQSRPNTTCTPPAGSTSGPRVE